MPEIAQVVDGPGSMTGLGPLVTVRDLSVAFAGKAGWAWTAKTTPRAVDGVSFDLHRGETLGVIGESGCGKTTMGRALLHLIRPTSGSVHFGDVELGALRPGELRRMRRQMQMVFQDPYSSLDARWTVGDTLREPLFVHRIAAGAQAEGIVDELLDAVGLPASVKDRYPHEFSGGQRQRISIARALVAKPALVVCDEPTASLDVSVQAQIVNLLSDLQDRYGLTYLFIAHDLSIVRHFSHRIAVMYLGRIVEIVEAEEITTRAAHPYTRSLLAAVREPGRVRVPATGSPARADESPGFGARTQGCSFHPRCPHATDICRTEVPATEAISARHQVACHNWSSLSQGAAG